MGVSLTLPKRTGSDLDTGGNTVLGVTGGDGVDLTELLQVVHRDGVTRKVKHDVLQGTAEESSTEAGSADEGLLTRDRWRGRNGRG
jgi:hypothetical protein